MGKIRSSVSSPISEPQGIPNVSKRVFTVPDGHGSDDDIPPERNFVTSGGKRFELPEGARQISPGEFHETRSRMQQMAEQPKQAQLQEAKTRVEIITGIGRKTKDVPVDMGNGQVTTFSIRTLKGKEHFALAEVIEGSKTIRTHDGEMMMTITSAYDIRIETLKHALYAIDGVDINVVLGVSARPLEEQLAAREDLLHDMDDAFTKKLYKTYEELLQDIADKFGVKNEKDAKELAEAINKSGEAP
jgi:hypothetical protein